MLNSQPLRVKWQRLAIGPAILLLLAIAAVVMPAVFELVEEMRADGVEFELHRQGMLVAARDPKTAREELAKLRPMRAHGYELPDEILEADDLRAVEPALADEINGGFEVRQHWHVRPDSYTAGIAAARKANLAPWSRK